jgi:hypothetical protein
MAENLDKTNPEATTGLAKAKIRLADVSTEVKKVTSAHLSEHPYGAP